MDNLIGKTLDGLYTVRELIGTGGMANVYKAVVGPGGPVPEGTVVLDSGRVLRSGHTRDVFADPRSITAARLTGCKNILPCTRLDAHTVYLTGWDVPLQLALPVPEGCTAVGIRAHDFVPCDAGAPNALPVAALSSSENPFDWNLICTAPDGTARLWWKVSKSTLFSPSGGAAGRD